MIKVGIIGGAGYTAGELIRLLLNHPEAEIVFINSSSNAGNKITDVHEGLYGETDLVFTDQLPLEEIDVLFFCTAHGDTKKFLESHNVPEELRIIDLSMDYRIASPEHDFIYGLPDYAAEKFSHYDLSYAGGRPLFATVGSFENRKGQDIFCKAIRLLPPETMKKASFLFVGKAAEAEMMDAVRSLTADCPDNVFYVKRLTRDEIKSLMAQCTCLVCASRDDPMPTFVTEGLIFGKPAIVSEHTGTAGLITEGVDGFVYEDDDPEKLAERLAWAIEHPEKLAAMRPACRELYESHYSKQAFSDSLQQAVKELAGE